MKHDYAELSFNEVDFIVALATVLKMARGNSTNSDVEIKALLIVAEFLNEMTKARERYQLQ